MVSDCFTGIAHFDDMHFQARQKMAVYDGMPPVVRRALWEAPVSDEALLKLREMLRAGYPPETVVRLVEKSWRLERERRQARYARPL